MKKIFILLMSFLTINAMAQTTGQFEVHEFDGFKLHVYHTNDALGDASYIIESKKGLVTLEQPLMKVNVAEYDNYLEGLDKKVVRRIASYHIGGTADHDIVMAEGMPEFTKGPIYGGMMQGFSQMFGDAMTDLPTGNTSEVAFDSVEKWAGVSYEFLRGASTDFPGASIMIGGQVYYTHWTPAKAHMSNLQVSSPAAIDAEIAEAEKSLATGAVLFIGGHGGAADRSAVEFKIAYLKTMKQALAANTTSEGFVAAMKSAYPGLPGEANLDALAQTFYK